MTSERQILANRLNAEKSTGPRSDEGKALVALNATKHGLLSQSIVIKGEDENAYLELRENLLREFEPVGPLESDLVERIGVYMWRLRRIFSIEVKLLSNIPRSMERFDSTKDDALAFNFNKFQGSIGTLTRYEVCIERMMTHALERLRVLQAERTIHILDKF